MGIDGTAAAGAAVADGVEAVQHGIFEKGVMHVAAFFFSLHDGDCLLLADPPGLVRMMLHNKTGKGFAYDQADILRLAGFFLRRPAGAFQNCNMIRVFQDDVPCPFVGNDLFQVGHVEGFVDSYEFAGLVKRHDFAVVSIGKGDFCFIPGWRGASTNLWFGKEKGNKAEKRPENFC